MNQKTEPNPIADYEQHVAALEKLIAEMEGDSLPLDQALTHYEQGIALIRQCQQALDSAEQKVQILMNTRENKETLQPFPSADSEHPPSH